MIKIAIAEDHTLFRQAFASFCTQQGFDVVLLAGNGIELIDKLKHTHTLPEVIFMDIRMPEMNGKEATAVITKTYPSIKVIVLSTYEHEKHIIDMLNAGAKGYLRKSADQTEIVKAVDNVVAGNAYYCPKMLATWNVPLPDDVVTTSNKKYKTTLLNEREYEFISRCASDDSYQQIANKMGIAYRTIDCYRASVCTKLKIVSRAGLAIYSALHGLLDHIEEFNS